MGILSICLRQNIHTRAVQKVFLETKLAFALRKLFERQFAVECDHMRRVFPKPLRQYDAPFRKVFARQLRSCYCGALYEVGQADTKFNHAFVIVIIKWLRNHSAFIEHRPELVHAPSIIMADTH